MSSAYLGRLPLVLMAIAGCVSASGPQNEAPVVQPGAPGDDTRTVDAEDAAAWSAAPPHTHADVEFMQSMIPHHQQALVMTRLASERAASEAVRQMALRMRISQRDEIELIRRWLAARGEPDAGAHGAMLMPGMLTPEEMERLANATGSRFDALFLELMIRHHEGAITMVERLFATSGAAQGTEIFQVASDVESDQRMEIDRMRRVLQEPETR